MTERLYVYAGDTVPLQVSWFLPSPDDPYVESDAVISLADATIVRKRDQRIMAEGVEATISGNETTYVVPSEQTRIAGSYVAFMSATFNDDNRMTKRIEYEVLPKR